MNDSPPPPPPGWGPIFRSSALLDHLGGFHSRGQGAELEIGLRILPQHANARGSMHGGVIATLADIALGYLAASRSDPARMLVTSSLTVDFIGPAQVGDWIEVKLDAVDESGRTVFAAGHLRVAERIVARARALFAARPTP